MPDKEASEKEPGKDLSLNGTAEADEGSPRPRRPSRIPAPRLQRTAIPKPPSMPSPLGKPPAPSKTKEAPPKAEEVRPKAKEASSKAKEAPTIEPQKGDQGDTADATITLDADDVELLPAAGPPPAPPAGGAAPRPKTPPPRPPATPKGLGAKGARPPKAGEVSSLGGASKKVDDDDATEVTAKASPRGKVEDETKPSPATTAVGRPAPVIIASSKETSAKALDSTEPMVTQVSAPKLPPRETTDLPPRPGAKGPPKDVAAASKGRGSEVGEGAPKDLGTRKGRGSEVGEGAPKDLGTRKGRGSEVGEGAPKDLVRTTLPFGAPVRGGASPAPRDVDPTHIYSRSGGPDASLAASSAAEGEGLGGDTALPRLDNAAFYRREARAINTAMPDRAAAMWLEVARLSGREDDDGAAPEASFDEALAAAAEAAPSNVASIGQLRRLALRRRDLARGFELGQRQVDLGGPNPTRVAVLLENAAVARFEQGDRPTAKDCLDRALDLAPAEVVALAQVKGLHLELGEDKAAVERLEQLTETLSVPRERARCLHTTGLLLEGALGQPTRALEAYGRAFEADPTHVPALLGAIELCDELGEWSALAKRLEQLAELAPGDAARLYLRAGRLHLDRSGDLEAAVRSLSAAATAAPRDAGPLTRLALALEARGAYRELVATLERLDALTFDTGSCAALRTRMGAVAEAHLADPEAAIVAYRRALEISPGYLPALSALGTLYRRRGDYEALLAILAPEAEDDGPPIARAERCLEMAAILDRELGRPADAVAQTRRALELTPGAWPAFALQRRLLLRLERPAALAELLGGQVEACADIKSRHHWLLELARLEAGPLGTPERAAATYRQAREVEVNRSPAIELADLLEREGRWPELVELLLAEAEDTGDPMEGEGYRLRAAALLEERLEEPDRALELLTAVRRENPACLAAIRAAGRVLDRLGRWGELRALYREQLGRARDDARRAELLCRIGRLEDERLGEPGAAIETYLEALRRQPGIPAALAALERLVRHEQRYDVLIDVLRRSAEAASDPHQAADALCRAAEIADTQSDDRDLALTLYEEALAASEGFFPALYGKLSLQLRGKSHADAGSTLGALLVAEGQAGAEEARSLAELSLWRHREVRGVGVNALDQKGDLAASPFVACLRAELVRLARRCDEDLSGILADLAEDTHDEGLAAAHFLEAAQRSELFDADDAQHLALASQAYMVQRGAKAGARSHSASPPPTRSLAIVWSLQRALERNGRWQELAALYEQEAVEEGEFAVRIPILSEAAGAHLQAGAPAEAARVARQCLSGDRHHLPSLMLLARLAEEQRSSTELASYADQIVEACRDRHNRLAMALIASDCWAHQVGEKARALASLQPALSDDPGQPQAFARAERLLSELADCEQLSQLYSRRISVCDDLQQRVELLRLNARLLRDRLDDATRAIAEFGQLLALAPEDIDGLREQAQLLQEHLRWSDAVGCLGTLIEVTDDTALRRWARLQQAELLLRQLHEPRRARTVLEQSLGEQGADEEARQLLVEAHLAEGSWEEARVILEQLAQSESGPDTRRLRVWALDQLAELARSGLRQQELFERSERLALETAAPDKALLRELVSRFVDRGEAQRLRGVLARLVEGSTTADAVMPLRLALANLLLETFGDSNGALEQLRSALVVNPDDEDARLLTGRALEARDEVEAAIRAYRSLLIDRLSCIDAARGLARIMGARGHHPVVAMASSVLELAGVASPSEYEHVDGFDRAGAPQGRLVVLDLPLLEEDERDGEDLVAVERFLTPLLQHFGSVYKLPLSATVGASHPAAAAARQIGSVFGLATVQLSIENGRWPAVAGVGRPVPLRVSAELAARPEEAPFRFWVGRALGAAATCGSLLEQLDDGALELMLKALAIPKPESSEVAQQRKQLLRAMPRKLRKQVEQSDVPKLRRGRWEYYRQLERQRADRVGLLCSSNPRVALRQLEDIPGPRLRRLLEFGLSVPFSEFYRLLWGGRG